MRFDSVTFWLFFAVAWAAWRALPFRLAKTATLLSSLLFYGWWRWEYLGLILFSAVVDHQVAHRVHRSEDPGARRGWLLVSLVSNLGLLAVFKYTPFALTSLAQLTGWPTIEDHAWIETWVIPVGISFYTFQTLSYTIDVYRRQLTPCASFRDFFLYVSFFPQLVAGPIVRAREFLPQLERRRPLRAGAVQMGLYRVLQGLFLKICIADNLSVIVGRLYGAAGQGDLTAAEGWLAVVYFGVQLFSDFAGYSGIAIGLAYLMGLRFPENFRYPFIATSIADTWRRWHISLSTWLRDYLYIPLGGNRVSPGRRELNLLITMVLGGLWHGPAWTFVLWGAFHGVGLALESRLDLRPRAPMVGRPTGPGNVVERLARIAVAYLWFTIPLAFFRAQGMAPALSILEAMFVAPFRGELGLEHLLEARFLVLCLPVFGLHLGQLLHEWYGLRKSRPRRALLAAAYALGLLVIPRTASSDFIYFQF